MEFSIESRHVSVVMMSRYCEAYFVIISRYVFSNYRYRSWFFLRIMIHWYIRDDDDRIQFYPISIGSRDDTRRSARRERGDDFFYGTSRMNCRGISWFCG